VLICDSTEKTAESAEIYQRKIQKNPRNPRLFSVNSFWLFMKEINYGTCRLDMFGSFFSAGFGCGRYPGYPAEKKRRIKERAENSPFFL